jgi:membrane-bound ClpP family serine protease
VCIGDKGTAVTRLAPMGNARFGNNLMEVISMDGVVNSGSEIEVVMLDDAKVYVKICK